MEKRINTIKGLENVPAYYTVTTNGEVISYRDNPNGNILKGYLNTKKYLLVDLTRKYRAKKIHRLVALAFIDNPNNYPQVNHKDGNKINNNVNNLEWCNNSQNQIHAIKQGLKRILRGEECFNYNKEHKNNRAVLQFTTDNIFIREYFSLAMAARAVGGKKYSNIARACRCDGIAYGYKWKFK